MPEPLLSVDTLSVEFAPGGVPVRVVQDVSFEIGRGEKFALVGESGSGKTVTALSLLRLNIDAHYSGQVRFDGEDVLALPEARLRDMRGKDAAMIFQEPMSALNPLYTIGEQICESIELHEGLARREAAQRVIELLARTGIAEPERRARAYPHQLSGGQRQRALIAMALACRPKLLIADEPTTALDVTIQRQILDLLNELQAEYGMAVLMITHDLNMVRHFAGRVGVMQEGRLVEVAPTEVLFETPSHAYTRRLLDSRPRRSVATPAADAPVLIEAQALRCRFTYRKGWFRRTPFDAVRDAALSVRRGETLGIVGESGSGKTTLGMALLRLCAAQVTGTVCFGGADLYRMAGAELRALRRRMQVVFQDPFASLSPRMTIGRIVGEGLALHHPDLDRDARRARIVAALEEVGLSDDVLNRYPHEFSGGQRQRIAIARAVALRPELLLLDEPTSALDVSVQQQVLQLLAGLQQRHGMTYVFITHDLAVIRAMAHHVIVMRSGELVEAGTLDRVFERPAHAYTQRLLSAAL
ncbi:MAG: ABC transporter ATP-binding protein [Burkholderiales bacterium]|nr:MAG: ABC transporter ATP-binding protein [Burkholderiales bacterium]